ncbi:MAG: (2Fe-2S) ferredoxin domain-containing protein [Bacteroidales bacterium]|jgi:NADH:ubiquinone oxidoreductase subunit E|nr:(2Fe-2S) ferredoxin domain-containing protein [Bacteroidales bacterium]
MIKATEMQICLGSSCFSRGNKDVAVFIKEYLKKHHLEDKVIFRGARCIGNCTNGPNLNINGKIIEGITLAGIEDILDRELAKLKQSGRKQNE